MADEDHYTWEQKYHRDELKELAAKREKVGAEFTAKTGIGDPMQCPEFVRLRLSEETCANFLRQADNAATIKRTRDRNTKVLGEQYGRASRTIRQQRGEIALLQSENTKLRRQLLDHRITPVV